MALDDYFFSFTITGFASVLLRRARKRFGIKYRVGAFLSPFHSLRSFAIYCCFYLARLLWKVHYIQFDERLLGTRILGDPLLWIPDFWSGPFISENRNSGRKRYGYAGDDFVLLLIGAQDERKGIDFVIRAIPRLFEEIPDLKLCVHGKIQPAYHEEFEASSDESIKFFPVS